MDSGKVLLEEVDESVGGGVVGVHLCAVLELRLDLLGQLFAQLHPDDATAAAGGGDGGRSEWTTHNTAPTSRPSTSRPNWLTDFLQFQTSGWVELVVLIEFCNRLEIHLSAVTGSSGDSKALMDGWIGG